MKRLLERMLQSLALKVVRRQRPRIVVVTGSVGKTSTKEAIATLLAVRFRVRAAYKNYNNELGVPLTIIGEKSPRKSFVGWMKVLWRGWRLARTDDPAYPEVLVLELGADRPGDIKALTVFGPFAAAVITRIGTSHLEFFGSQEAILKEKASIIEGLAPDGVLMVNGDDPLLVGRFVGEARLRTFALHAEAHARVGDIHVRGTDAADLSPERVVLSGTIHVGSMTIPFSLPATLSRHQLYPVLAGALVAERFQLFQTEIAEGISKFRPVAGRMRLLSGIKHTLIIDDTYNSSPESLTEALRALGQFQGHRRVAILGDMRELGEQSSKLHRVAGREVPLHADLLIVAGEGGKATTEGAREAGMSEDEVIIFPDREKLMDTIESILREGDVVLVKASEKNRFEFIVRDIMGEPRRAKELLVRQGEGWN